MEKDPVYFEELIAKYFSGEATPAEITELSGWVALEPGNGEIFSASQKAWMGLEAMKVDETVEVSLALEALNKKITSDELLVTDNRSEKREARSEITNNSLFTGSNLFVRNLLRVAAVILLLAIPSFLLFRYFQKPAMKEMAANDGRFEAQLPDGSKVTLNSGAVIRFPEKFKGSKRAVSLDGEAYFDVAHNASKPFIIATDGIRVEVKGTSFYINTRSMDGGFELVLTSGKVDLYFAGEESAARVLLPGEKAVVRDRKIIISPNMDANYMAWKTRRISFNNDALNTVAATLCKVYQANIRLTNPLLANCRLTATFDNQSLESVLNVLKATLDLDIRNSGSLVDISGKGCR